MNENIPLVSVITPAYNAQKYIAQTIRSVLDQSYENWELLIIDDGSRDDTAKIVSTFEDERIHLISQENRGVSTARNAGLDLAKGKYITFLDADDLLPQDSLKSRVEYLEQNSDIDVVHGDISIRDESLQTEYDLHKPFYYENLLKKTLYLDNRMSFNPCYMIRKEKLQVRFKEGMTHAEDILFFIGICVNNLKLGYIPKTMYYYRVTSTSVSSNIEGLKQGYFDLLKHIRDYPSISYLDTIIMRMKIAKILIILNIKNRKKLGIIDLLKIVK